MSFLNTMANLGGKLPPTATFFLVDHLTTTTSDGFHVMSVACTVVGVAWIVLAVGPVRRMQRRELAEWRVGGASAAGKQK